ncbi:MAG: HAMP domain-containing histidine kinase [Planctomycetia bacterium]|nr:HAMP domain-containing histidine kinase [Planctomycetia bacterium]
MAGREPLSDAAAVATAAESGVALVPPGESARALANQGCVNLARAILSESLLLAGRPEHDDEAWGRAAEDPAVAAWLQAVRRAGHAFVGDGPPLLLPARLGEAVVVGEKLSPEASLLLDILALVADGRGSAQRNGRAIAEARLEAARELAYGAGHEINNPLANIAARAQSLLPGERDPERRRRLSTIVDQAFRARDMIGGLMIFARPPKPQPADVGIDALVRPAVDAVRSLAESRGVRLEYSPPPAPVAARVDASQVAEAIRVLAVNAIEAVEPGGRVILEAAGDGGGGRCLVLVSDDGRGMDPEEARRSFDPFFSGRDAGRGIGLGLPKALRLVESSGGTLTVDSKRGGGTRITLSFPAAAEASAGG